MEGRGDEKEIKILEEMLVEIEGVKDKEEEGLDEARG